jgi:biopolymer transport protein ExbD
MKFARRNRMQHVEELNITAFMDLLVALISFLLITAVFTRMSVVELNLPPLNANNKPQEDIKLALQLVVREHSFDIQDANLGLIRSIARNPANTDWQLFTKILTEIKYRFPDEQNITLLLEPSVNYKTMIQVMDHVRSADLINMATVETVELFPSISMGDAPELGLDNTEANTDENTEESTEESAEKNTTPATPPEAMREVQP